MNRSSTYAFLSRSKHSRHGQFAIIDVFIFCTILLMVITACSAIVQYVVHPSELGAYIELSDRAETALDVLLRTTIETVQQGNSTVAELLIEELQVQPSRPTVYNGGLHSDVSAILENITGYVFGFEFSAFFLDRVLVLRSNTRSGGPGGGPDTAAAEQVYHVCINGLVESAMFRLSIWRL